MSLSDNLNTPEQVLPTLVAMAAVGKCIHFEHCLAEVDGEEEQVAVVVARGWPAEALRLLMHEFIPRVGAHLMRDPEAN